METGYLENIVYLKSNYFAEGLTAGNEYIWQLTWQEGIVIVRDKKNFKIIREYTYQGEGWGICFDGKYFIVSNGSEYLQFRNNSDFSVVKRVCVRDENSVYSQLNELEYYNGFIYSNVWMTNNILKIDVSTGKIVKKYDLTELYKIVKKEANDYNIDVLNGIAHIKENYFLISGKQWPKIFCVELK